ncbi:MAG: hypothetical protein RLY14_1517 [Planctomycetota bacterium]|jgi:hypothetical protein
MMGEEIRRNSVAYTDRIAVIFSDNSLGMVRFGTFVCGQRLGCDTLNRFLRGWLVISESTHADLRSLRTRYGDGTAIALLVGVASLQMDD